MVYIHNWEPILGIKLRGDTFPWPGVLASCGQQLVIFDAQNARFRSIKLRPKQASCAVCGENPSVTQLVDYETFCGSAATDKVDH